MRQVLVQVPEGRGDELASAARELGASTMSRLRGTGGDGQAVDVLIVTVPNGSVGTLIDRAQDLGEAEASVPATGAFAFEPPAGEPPDELVDVTPRSGYEVVLAGQQSAGSWRGFVTFAAVAGAVVWLGLFTETVYLLTGSMLIAPFAGPAMNTAISLVAGRPGLLRHSVLRYLVGIIVTAVVAGLLSLMVGQQMATGLMASVLTITIVAVLLPLAAGVAGATFLVQSEHSSLISGAAVGILVAASLAPPAGGLGMAVAIGRFDLVYHAAFLIGLQLAGITASAVVVLWLYGIRPGAQRFTSERRRILIAGVSLAALITGGLVLLQFLTGPSLVQGSRSREAAGVVASAVADRQDVALLRVDPNVASSQLPGPPRLVIDVVLERQPGATKDPQELKTEVQNALLARLRDALPDVVPHVDLTLLEPPAVATGR